MKKLKNQKGFTLVEMLVCVITLLILAGICTAGTNIAMNSYNRSLFESNSQMLESTLDMYMGDIMRHCTPQLEATSVESGNKKVKSITNTFYGMYEGWIDISADGRFFVHKTEVDTTGVQLLSEKVYTKALKISDFELEYNETKKYIVGSYTIESTVVPGLKKQCDFKYRILTTN